MTKTTQQVKEELGINTDIDIKSLLQRASNIEDEAQKIKDEKKDLMLEVKTAGLDSKAFSVALRIMRNPPAKDFTETVNSYLEEGGQMAFFV
jgi:uncharacterized protein (UPF0335 family)